MHGVGATGLKDSARACPGDQVESGNGIYLAVVEYRPLHLLVGQENKTFEESTHELILDSVAHVPKLGKYYLLPTL